MKLIFRSGVYTHSTAFDDRFLEVVTMHTTMPILRLGDSQDATWTTRVVGQLGVSVAVVRTLPRSRYSGTAVSAHYCVSCLRMAKSTLTDPNENIARFPCLFLNIWNRAIREFAIFTMLCTELGLCIHL